MSYRLRKPYKNTTMKKIHFLLFYILIIGSCFTVYYINKKQYEHCKYTLINSNGDWFRVVSYKKIHDNCIEAYDEEQNMITVCGEYTIKPR